MSPEMQTKSMLIDEAKTLEALDGNRELLFQLAQIFCEDAPLLLGEFESAVLRDDPHAARIAAHSLKGLVSTFYAIPVVEAAYSVESECGTGQLDSVRNGPATKLGEMVRVLIDEIKTRGWCATIS